MAAHKAKRIDSDTVEYRGTRIKRHTETPTGYYGRYSIGGYRNGQGFSTLRGAKEWVDAKRDSNKAE